MRADRILRERLRETLLVTLDNGEAFAGVLYATDARSWILRDARAVTAGQSPAPVDGELILPRDRVIYAQRLDPIRL